MNRRALFLIVAAPIVFAAVSHAGDEKAPAAPTSVPATTTNEAAAPAAETKPEVKPAAKPESKPAAEIKAAPEARAEEKPLNPCAAKLEPVVDAYQLAHDGMLAWLREASGKMAAGDAKIAGLKKLIAENEARITQLKLDAPQNGEAQTRDLDQQTRGLWSQLKVEESRQKDLCRALTSAAGRKVRELNQSVLGQFEKSSQTP